MSSQKLGNRTSDQKIENVFHAFGYSIPVGKDGRRLWPIKFKREMARRMKSGTLSVADVQRTCQIPDKTAYAWRKGSKQKNLAKRQKRPQESSPVFAKIKVQNEVPAEHVKGSHIVFKRAGCELLLPSTYSVTGLVELIRAFESRS